MLGILAIFKYFQFFFDSLNAIVSIFALQLHPVTLKLLLPVGISFYTFQTLSYVIDVYRGDCPAEKNFGIYATFVSFFPQLVAGPIERTKNLLPQIREEHSFDYHQGIYGAKLILWGLFKKMVVADNLSIWADTVFNDIYAHEGSALLMAAFFFTLQIYCDFSGYSDIARGSAKLLGIELMENFRSPYFSSTIKEFWSRWHISLSTWFRDYVYIPLGGNRVRRGRHYLNLLLTFLASGLWHGANWTFVVWGGLHGILQITEDLLGLRPADREKHFWRWAIRCILVFGFAALAWVFFRVQSFSEAAYFFHSMFVGLRHPLEYIYAGLRVFGITAKTVLLILAVYILPLAAYDYFTVRSSRDAMLILDERTAPVVRWILCVLLAVLIILFCPKGVPAAFVYFQF